MSSINYPILEFDSNKKAIIDPSLIIEKKEVPEICIFPFYYHVIQQLNKKGFLEEIARIESTITPPITLYGLLHNGKRLAVITPGLGAPFAAGNLELAIALGCRKFIVIGSCGVLDSEILTNQFIIPTSAIRDEGTSYHYIPPSREIKADSEIVEKMQSFLFKKKIKYQVGKTWTTDGFFRETYGKIQRRIAEGAIIVEMEAAALFAVAQFRNVRLGYILAGGDDVSGLTWDRRLKMRSVDFYEKFFWLSADICIELFS